MRTKAFKMKCLGLVFLWIFSVQAFSQTAESYYNQAYQASLQKDHKQVIDYTSKALELNPGYGAAYWLRGNAKFYLKDYSGGISDYSSAISYYQDDANQAILYVNRSDCKIYLNDFDGALADCDIAVLKKPDYGKAYWYKARAYKGKDEYQKAIDEYAKAINYLTDNNDLAIVYVNRSDCKRNLNDYDGAIADCDNAVLKKPDYGRAYWYKGLAYKGKKEYQKAIDEYTKAINYLTDNNDLAIVYVNRSDCKRYINDFDGALADCNTALQKDPDYGRGYWYRGLAYEGKKEYKNAVDDHLKAITYYTGDNENLTILYRNIGSYKYSLSEYDEGLLYSNKSLALDPLYTNAYWDRGLIYLAKKEYNTALENFDKTISLESDKADLAKLYYDKALCRMGLKEYTTAIQDCNKALEYNPDYAFAYETRAKAYYSTNNYRNAANDYGHAINFYLLDPVKQTSLLKSRADCLTYLNDYTGAVADYTRVIELSPDISSYENRAKLYYYKLNDREKAKSDFIKVADMDIKNDTCVIYSYAKSYIGEKEPAINNMQRLINLHSANKDILKWDYHNLACIYNISGDEANALKALETSFKNGFDDFDHLDTDDDLKTLTNNTSYKAMIAKYRYGKADVVVVEQPFMKKINTEVNAAISQWEKKEEFETTQAYNDRLKNRESKIKMFTNAVISKYKQAYLKEIDWKKAALRPYNADLQTFSLLLPNVYDIELYVPLGEAPIFKANFNKMIFSAQDVTLKDGKWTLIYMKITNPVNQKTYIYSEKN